MRHAVEDFVCRDCVNYPNNHNLKPSWSPWTNHHTYRNILESTTPWSWKCWRVISSHESFKKNNNKKWREFEIVWHWIYWRKSLENRNINNANGILQEIATPVERHLYCLDFTALSCGGSVNTGSELVWSHFGLFAFRWNVYSILLRVPFWSFLPCVDSGTALAKTCNNQCYKVCDKYNISI